MVISDGQAWSGEVENALVGANERGMPVFVLGVGTTVGGPIPNPPPRANEPVQAVLYSSLDRPSLRNIAQAGGGTYFDLAGATDREIALRIVTAVGRRASRVSTEETYDDLYWQFLFAAGLVIAFGVLFLQEKLELALQIAGAIAVLLILGNTIL